MVNFNRGRGMVYNNRCVWTVIQPRMHLPKLRKKLSNKNN